MVNDFSELKDSKQYKIKVRTPNQQLSQLTYEYAMLEFGSLLNIREKGDVNGVIEITFSSQGQSAFIGSSTSTTISNVWANAWYTGYGASMNATGTSNTTDVTSGTMFQWQNGNMVIVIKDTDGKRLWGADYNYKGGWEMSGWIVNTSEDAARLLIKRLAKKFKNDFKI